MQKFDSNSVRSKAPSSRALIDQLISETKLYSRQADLKQLFDFTSKLRHIAPFNTMLLHVQKPGLSFAATAKDWRKRFGVEPKPYARPLLILRNFGPVEFVFDVLDVEPELPEHAYAFPTYGDVPFGWIDNAVVKLRSNRIYTEAVDQGDYRAGHVRMTENYGDPTQKNKFELVINANHPEPIKFVTLMHELAHIYLGHCGEDMKRGIKARTFVDRDLREVEAESVAYVIAKRSGITPKSERYLDSYRGALDQLDIHSILQVSGQIERSLGLPLALWP